MFLLSFFITFWKILITPRNSKTILYSILPLDPFSNIQMINKNDTNKNITLAGVDERIIDLKEKQLHLDSEEKLLKKIILNKKKQELLKILESDKNVFEKYQFVKENNYLFNDDILLLDSIQSPNIFKGNLLKESDFDFF
jgi:hypothetical protein